jgi:transglutaminase-like putative cysteine protease
MKGMPMGIGMSTGIRSLLFMFLVIVQLRAQQDVLTQARTLEESGKFSEAAALLTSGMNQPGRSADAKRALAWEIERLDRIRFDYSYSADRLFAQVQRSVKNVTREEFDRWDAEGKFDKRSIDGELRYLNVSRSNLFWRYPEIAARRVNPPNDSAFDRAVWKNCIDIMKASMASGEPYVHPKTFRVVMTLTIDSGAVPAGETVRAWLPVPRTYPFQREFRLVASDPPVVSIAPDESPIRSAYLERVASHAGPTKFRIEYEYTADGIWFNTATEAVAEYDTDDPEYRRYTAEAPHIVFTDAMKALAKEIAGTETNPLVRARSFYRWIAENIQYSYAREYSTIRNIGGYCLEKKYGDCGQEAFLFMTLCRLSGIPARWQSAWFTFPGGKTIHDWCEISIPPYGWIPVDPYMGIFAMQYLETLGPVQQRAIRDFYFGGLDQYRIAANSDHCQTLEPAKQYFRSDVVDFQRGEVEWSGGNIYFDKWDYSLTIEEKK